MGFLDKLWDDTLAGPAPESGLGKLRKYDSLSFRPRSSSPDDFPVSRRITIVRSHSVGARPAPNSSPAPTNYCTTPTSPLIISPATSPKGAGDFTFNRWKKKDTSHIHHDTISPTTLYDWIVINALDR